MAYQATFRYLYYTLDCTYSIAKTGQKVNNENSPKIGYFGVYIERVRGVEPLSRPWQGRVIPIYNTRKLLEMIIAKKRLKSM